MLRVLVSSARPGMTLALPVYHPQIPGHMLLKPGAVLDGAAILRLRELRIYSLWVRYPALDCLMRFVSPRVVAEQAGLTALLAEGFDALSERAHAPLDFGSYADSVRSLLDRLIADPHAAVFLHAMVDARPPLLARSSNVCFLSLLMGLKLEVYLIAQRAQISAVRAKQIENLGVGALLHDIGMIRLPPGMADRWQVTGDDSDPVFRDHVRAGYDLVRGKIAPTAAAVVLHHHQRFDGEGFPAMHKPDGRLAPLAGHRIHIFSRIVAVASQFERLRAASPNPSALAGAAPVPAVRALRVLLNASRERSIDPVVFKALLAVVPAFPPGSTVGLSDGSTAVVTGWNPSAPCRPTVRRIDAFNPRFDEAPLLGPPLELRAAPHLAIVSADGDDVTGDLFAPAHLGEFDLRCPLRPPTLASGAPSPAMRLASSARHVLRSV